MDSSQKRKKFSLTRMAYQSTTSTASILSTESDGHAWTRSTEQGESSEILVQLRELNKDVDSALEFVCGVDDIICTSIPVNIGLAVLGILSVVETSFGVRHLSHCPVEPRVPVFLFVGGCFGLLKIIHMLYTNYRNRKLSMYVAEFNNRNIQRTFAAVDSILSLFLVAWQAAGAYWTLGVWRPHWEPPLHEPDNWCHQGLYVFALVHLGLSAAVLAARLLPGLSALLLRLHGRV
ncbi:hypothetical protein EGW08_007876 [Elysia chlorotica]|uniref:Uncharacterized protein n=1 Tax=Elysia chlorotica TaxID=188477 RepID=A0A433TS06_ELYCH|nr:hypothetical protein EGW08_007876 [Elysia chlorotica]